MLVDDVGHAVSVKLAPTLVEYNPVHDRGVVLECINDACPLALHVGLGLCLVALNHIATGHILPYEDTLAVGVVVPAVGLNLDVLAYHIATQVLHGLDVEEQSLVAGGCVKTVGPETLIQGTKFEDLLAVEVDARNVVGVLLNLDAAHTAVALNLVGYLAVLLQSDDHIIEIGVLGRPGVNIGYSDA